MGLVRCGAGFIPAVLVGGLLAALAAFGPGAARAQSAGWDYLANDRASLFDLGVVALEFRFFQVAQVELAPAGLSALVRVKSNRARRTLEIVVEVPGGGPACGDFRRRLQAGFTGSASARADAAATEMDRLFLHRGVVSQVSPSVVGIDLAEASSLTVISGGETCSGGLTD